MFLRKGSTEESEKLLEARRRNDIPLALSLIARDAHLSHIDYSRPDWSASHWSMSRLTYLDREYVTLPAANHYTSLSVCPVRGKSQPTQEEERRQNSRTEE